ncbi:MAG: lipoate--protein ligase family protein [Gemmataceae bacterium]
MTTARLFPFEVLPGPINMAADDVLLQLAVAGTASLRFYGWSEPMLSLGYFQPFASRTADPHYASLAVVRRSTGGGAIVHHHELTYCLGIPADQVGKEPWSCRVHHIITGVLDSFGVTSDTVVCGEEQKTDPVLCFHHHTAGDVAVGPRTTTRHKIVGSAQRKQHGAIVQHGSIILATSEHAPSLPGIRELTGVTIKPQLLAMRMLEKLKQDTGWEFQTSSWTADEQQAIQTIAREKYGHRDWTEKR